MSGVDETPIAPVSETVATYNTMAAAETNDDTAVTEAAPLADDAVPTSSAAATGDNVRGETPPTQQPSAAESNPEPSVTPIRSTEGAQGHETPAAADGETTPAEPAAQAMVLDTGATPTPTKRKSSSGRKKKEAATDASPAAAAAGGGNATPRTPRAKSPATGTKTPRGRSAGASTAKKGTKGATPGSVKKKLAAAAPHIPKRSLSYGRNLQDVAPATPAAAPSEVAPAAEDATLTPNRPTGGQSATTVTPSGLTHLDAPLSRGSTAHTMPSSPMIVRKPILRLYGEAAENAVDDTVRAKGLFDIGWIYATGTTGIDANVEKAYAYFYHAAKGGHHRARYCMALLQLSKTLGTSPPFDPMSVGQDASPARSRARGRSASPQRSASAGVSSPRGATPGASAQRAKSPRRKSAAGGGKKGPFGGLTKAIENLRLCVADAALPEAMVELAYLSDPDFPAPLGYVDPAVTAAKATAADKLKKTDSKTPSAATAAGSPTRARGPAAATTGTAKTPATPRSPAAAALGSPRGAADGGAEYPESSLPTLVRSYAAALEHYRQAIAAGSVAAQMRVEDIQAILNGTSPTIIPPAIVAAVHA
jgi:TPR repeat protein